MGQSKRQQEEQESQRETIKQILIEVGVLEECALHEEVFESGCRDFEEALSKSKRLGHDFTDKDFDEVCIDTLECCPRCNPEYY